MRVGREPGVTITKAGVFTINSLCVNQHLHDVKQVELLFDKSTKHIGFHPVTKEESYTYVLRTIKGMGQISGTAFLQYYGATQKEARFFPARWDDDIKSLVICLADSRPAGRRKQPATSSK